MDEDSGKLGYEQRVRDSRDVEDEVGRVSSGLLDMLHTKGKVTEPGPMALMCPAGEGPGRDLRWVSHPWSMYGVEGGEKRAGCEQESKP
ncbi:hypothetical protein [Streptomyces palmae]|uniref:Uncharacterized protein n=1 Tax=Streptomyces palmae TaxID=1701085 RepID=A0A4Z0G0F4_9ACTN|nr:hypothetical protein [Streptomyces palmae]TGA87669.1 hypothetical protein E4099_29935 [Streptomyces palmae]